MAQNGLPGVLITVENGALGRVATTKDGVAGLIVVGVSNSFIPLYTPKQIFGLKEAESLGLTQDADATAKVDTWQQIKEFYDEAGNGAELWIMTVALTKTMTEILDPNTTTNGARKLLDAAGGKIRLLGISRFIDSSVTYNQVTVSGLDEDVTLAMPKAQALAIEYRNNFKPFNVIIDGRGWNGNITALADLRTFTHSKVSVALFTTKASKTSAAVGLVLGRAAKLPVQRNIGRVKDGALNVGKLYYSNGAELITFSDAQVGQIHGKAYLTPRTFVGRSGYFITDDPTATTSNDDYLTIANNRVIDKALTIVYATYMNEINDEVEITSEGKLSATKVSYYRQIITNALELQMLSNGEVSAVDVAIDADQDVLATDIIAIEVRITPVGYAKEISVSLGFKNPAA
jgi:Protein of unknown function (DUF2586)